RPPTVAEPWNGDAEREVPGTVPIERAHFSSHRSVGVVLSVISNIRRACPRGAIVEFEILAVCRTRQNKLIARRQSDVEINVCSALGKRDGAKGRGSSTACDMVASELEGGLSFGLLKAQTGDGNQNC